MEAARTSETSVNFYQTTWHNNPEDSHLHTCRSENLKSYLMINSSLVTSLSVSSLVIVLLSVSLQTDLCIDIYSHDDSAAILP
jgi:hypothetical protein